MNLSLLGKEPIQTEQPTGSDARYTPEFEELQAEIEKLSLPSASSAVDWKKVEKLAATILGQKSKDLSVASYLAVALVYNRQVEGLALGMQIYRELLENFWENLYPAKSRMRGRVRAMEWWLEKIEMALLPLAQVSFPPESFHQLKENFQKIDDFLNQNVEEPPSVSGLRDFLRTIEESLAQQPPEVAPTPEEKPREAPPPPPEKVLRQEGAEVIASPQEAQRAVNSVLQRIREIAAYLAQEDLSNPQAYRWMRIAAWSQVENLPPESNGRTKIPPPAAQIRNGLIDFKNRGNHEALVKSAEGKIAQFIFWLDLHRLVAEALANLGSRYQAAREVVAQETAYLLHRFPGLVELSFSDGTPFADLETKGWLKGMAWGESSSPPGPSPLNASISASPDEDTRAKEIEKAQNLIREGKLFEAVEGMQQHLHRSSSQKEKVLWRLALSQLLIDAKKPRIARPYLEHILKDIDFYRLEEWDPELALKSLRLVWIGLSAAPDPAQKEKIAEILLRLAKLDLAEAMRLGLT